MTPGNPGTEKVSFTFQSLTSCAVISEEVMMNHFLPGLRCLHADMEQLSPEHEVRRHIPARRRKGFHSFIQTLTLTLAMHTYSISSAYSRTEGQTVSFFLCLFPGDLTQYW